MPRPCETDHAERREGCRICFLYYTNANYRRLWDEGPPRPPPSAPSSGLGDMVHDALAKVGITPEKIERWLGAPCGCKERQEKLNKLSRWAKRLVKRKKGQ